MNPAPVLSARSDASSSEAIASLAGELDDELRAAQLAPAASALLEPLALTPAIHQALDSFTPLNLDELKGYSLLNRTDTKFVFTEAQALEIFSAIAPYYRVLEVHGRRASHYFSQYYDTPNLKMYLDHHNGHRKRYKVRRRLYVDSGACFLEIKEKNNRERTLKSRLPVADGTPLEGTAADFVACNSPYDPAALIESSSNECLRVTLAGTESLERLTIDFAFSYQWRGLRGVFPGLVIAEVKQPRFNMQSHVMRQLSRRGLEPRPFSKYCISLAVLEPQIRYNRFKPLLLHVYRLLEPYLSNPGALMTSGRVIDPAAVNAVNAMNAMNSVGAA